MKKFLLALWAILALVLVALWLYLTPPGLLGKADAIGYAVCARNPAHSFFFGLRQMPLCARCTGMHTALMLTLLALWRAYPRRAGLPPRGIQIALALFALAFVVDGANSWMSDYLGRAWLYTPTNTLRLLSGLGMGMAMGAILYPLANQTLWERPDSRRILSLKGFVALLAAVAAAGALILSKNPLILFPVALLSAADVLFALTLIYTLFVVTLLGRGAAAARISDLKLPIALGATVAFLQIALFDILRFALTHTWGYFPPK